MSIHICVWIWPTVNLQAKWQLSQQYGVWTCNMMKTEELLLKSAIYFSTFGSYLVGDNGMKFLVFLFLVWPLTWRERELFPPSGWNSFVFSFIFQFLVVYIIYSLYHPFFLSHFSLFETQILFPILPSFKHGHYFFLQFFPNLKHNKKIIRGLVLHLDLNNYFIFSKSLF